MSDEIYMPEEQLEGMSEEDYTAMAIRGHRFINNIPDSKVIKKGDLFCIGGETYKVNESKQALINEFMNLPDDELKSVLMGIMAELGIRLTYHALADQGAVNQVNEEGEALTKEELDKKLGKEMKMMENTAALVRDILLMRGDQLDKKEELKDD